MELHNTPASEEHGIDLGQVLSGTRNNEPEIPLPELEELAAKDEKELHKRLKKETGRSSVSPIKRLLAAELDDQTVSRFRTACQGNEDLWKRIKPFAGLVRMDTFGYPVVVPNGSVYVTAGTDRRSSGTHYTPRSLTEPIVQYTLEPLVYEGPAEGKPKEEWRLKSPAELLDLNICDMACGSGAFLVQACRYMSERLLEAWEEVEKQIDGMPRITPTGDVSKGGPEEQLIPVDTEERLVYARRIIASRCLYGVDVNPLAAEMAKLSLWLLTLAKDKPFEFLDHAIRCGDSLIGLHDLEQLRHYSLKPDADDAVLFGGPFEEAVDEAVRLRMKLEDMPANTVADIEAQEKLLADAEEKIARLRCSADLLIAAEFWGENAADKEENVRHAANVSGHYVEKGPTDEFEKKASRKKQGQRMFHWPLEFPEVIVKHGGFHAFVGNPPFSAGAWLESQFGTAYRKHIVAHIANNVTGLRGTADLCVYFMHRIMTLSDRTGFAGLILTNTVSEGDSRAVGLVELARHGVRFYRAHPSAKWPGTATLEVVMLWMTNGDFAGPLFIGDATVSVISTSLTEQDDSLGDPEELANNRPLVCKGFELQGNGFKVSDELAHGMICEDQNCAEVLFPLLTGDDLNNSPGCVPQGHVINFESRELHEAQRYQRPFETVMREVKPHRLEYQGSTGRDKFLRTYWWLFRGHRKELEEYAGDHDRMVVRSVVSKYSIFAFVESRFVCTASMCCFLFDSDDLFAQLQSSFHEAWSRQYGSTLRVDLRYIAGRCFKTYPFAVSLPANAELGRRYHDERATIALRLECGLTSLYNRFHDATETAEDIQKLRNLHMEMDQAVAAAYGWKHLDLGHGFHETKQGVRYTISEPARREVLQRLLKLNHERYEEEVRQGLHDKKKKKATRKKKASKKQEATLFDTGGKE